VKANTTDLLKFKKLQKRLGESTRSIVGLLEMLWIATAKNCPRGDIGRFSNDEIALLVDWDKDPDWLVASLIECRWLDECGEFRLVIHDWAEHCPTYVRGNLAKHKRDFASAQQVAKHAAQQVAKQDANEAAQHVASDSATKSSQVKSSQVKPSVSSKSCLAEPAHTHMPMQIKPLWEQWKAIRLEKHYATLGEFEEEAVWMALTRQWPELEDRVGIMELTTKRGAKNLIDDGSHRTRGSPLSQRNGRTTMTDDELFSELRK